MKSLILQGWRINKNNVNPSGDSLQHTLLPGLHWEEDQARRHPGNKLHESHVWQKGICGPDKTDNLFTCVSIPKLGCIDNKFYCFILSWWEIGQQIKSTAHLCSSASMQSLGHHQDQGCVWMPNQKEVLWI